MRMTIDKWIDRAESKLAAMSPRQRVAMVVAVVNYMDEKDYIGLGDEWLYSLLDREGIEIIFVHDPNDADCVCDSCDAAREG